MRTSAIRCRIPNTFIEWLRFKVQNSHDVVFQFGEEKKLTSVTDRSTLVHYLLLLICDYLKSHTQHHKSVQKAKKRREKKCERWARNTHSETETDTCLIEQYPEWVELSWQYWTVCCFLSGFCCWCCCYLHLHWFVSMISSSMSIQKIFSGTYVSIDAWKVRHCLQSLFSVIFPYFFFLFSLFVVLLHVSRSFHSFCLQFISIQ